MALAIALALSVAAPAHAQIVTTPLEAADGASTDAPIDDAIAVAPLRSAEPDTAIRLDPIVITGTRTEQALADAPVDVQLITEQQIRNSGARDLAELLEREGGVHVTRVAARGTRIEIQGLSSEHVLILIDGRRMIGQIYGAIDLTRLRVADIERVEIVKGPSSALYGADALGGVVNVITRKGGGERRAEVILRGDIDGNAEGYGSASWTLGTLQGHSSAGYHRSSAFDLDERTLAEDGIDGDAFYGSTQATLRLGERAHLGFSGAYSLDDSHRLDPGIGTTTYDTHKRTEEVRLGVAPRLSLGANTDVSFDAYYHRFFDQLLQRNAISGAVAIDEETLDELYVAGGQIDHRLATHLISVGVEAQFEQLDADRLDTEGERDRQAVFVQDQFDVLDGRLQIVPGLRYDRDSQFDDQYSPKLALRYDLGERWVLRAGYGRGYRAPDFKQLLLRFENSGVGYRVEGNPDLQPERSTGFNAGATWFATDTATVSVSTYHNRVSDLIEIVQIESGPPIVFSYRNVAAARLSGVDLQTQWQLLPSLELRGGYGWLDAEDRATGERLSGRAEHRGNAALRFEQPDYALALRGVWIGTRQFTAEVDTGGPPTAAGTANPYALFDFRAEWTRWPRLLIAAGVENLLDEGDTRYLPIHPRTAYLELRWTVR